MSQINICIYCTETNDRLKLAKESIASLMDTVDLNKHSVVLINNNSTKETADWLSTLKDVNVITLSQNVGTARGINFGLRLAGKDVVQIKSDEDVVWHQSGWADELERVILERPEIGILGLKRDDVYGNFTEDGELLWSDDIMGTCIAFNPALLEKIGYLFQFSNYGFEDSLVCVRSMAAGFKNAFLPVIKISHIDPGASTYTEWKKREASTYLQEASIYMDKIKSGQLSYYYGGE
jgi:hypothetical protein